MLKKVIITNHLISVLNDYPDDDKTELIVDLLCNHFGAKITHFSDDVHLTIPFKFKKQNLLMKDLQI